MSLCWMNHAPRFNACCSNSNWAESWNWESRCWIRVFAPHKAPAWSPAKVRHHPRNWIKGKIILCLQKNSSPLTLAFYFLHKAVVRNEVTVSTVCELPSFLNAACSGEREGLGGGGAYRTATKYGGDCLHTHLYERPWSPCQQKEETECSLFAVQVPLGFWCSLRITKDWEADIQ